MLQAVSLDLSCQALVIACRSGQWSEGVELSLATQMGFVLPLYSEHKPGVEPSL